MSSLLSFCLSILPYHLYPLHAPKKTSLNEHANEAKKRLAQNDYEVLIIMKNSEHFPIEVQKEKITAYVEKLPGGWLALPNARDSLGASAFHHCFLFVSDANREIARWLLEKSPTLAQCSFGEGPYEGETALHMAIANRFSPNDVQWLLDKAPELVSKRAIGADFRDEKKLGDWGELPLSWAVAVNEPDIVRILVERGADMLGKDRKGDTALHIAVTYGRTTMISLLENLWLSLDISHGTSIKLFGATNNDGYTPLVHAARLGKISIFRDIWERNSTLAWEWGHVQCRQYGLDNVDDIVEIWENNREVINGRPPFPPRSARTALQLLTEVNFEDTDSNINLVEVPALAKIVDEKWKIYAEAKFLYKLRLTIFFLFIFSTMTILTMKKIPHNIPLRTDNWFKYASYLRLGEYLACASPLSSSSSSSSSSSLLHEDNSAYLCMMGITSEILSCFCVLIRAVTLLLELSRSGVHFFRARGAPRYSRLMGTLLVISYLGTGIAHNFLDQSVYLAVEDWAMPFSALSAWAHIIYFLLGEMWTGPFVLSLMKMILADIPKVSIIVSLLIVGISHGLAESGYVHDANIQGVSRLIYEGLVSISGGKSLEEVITEGKVPESVHYVVSTLTMVLRIVGGAILMNVLVAMFGDTYAKTLENSKHLWFLERARIILHIEEGMSVSERLSSVNTAYFNEDPSRKWLYFQYEHKDIQKFDKAENDGRVQEISKQVKDSFDKKMRDRNLSLFRSNSLSESISIIDEVNTDEITQRSSRLNKASQGRKDRQVKTSTMREGGRIRRGSNVIIR